MKATYALEGPMTLTSIIKFLREIQIERTTDQVIELHAETTRRGVTNLMGERTVPPEHVLRVTVEDE